MLKFSSDSRYSQFDTVDSEFGLKLSKFFVVVVLLSSKVPDYEQHLLQALEDLKQDPTLSIVKAAAHRAVPPSTLRDRKNRGMQNPTAAHQYDCLLSSTQEDILVKWALFQDDMGIPSRQELLKEKAEAILHLNNPDVRIGKR